jgi:hypothetical protein
VDHQAAVDRNLTEQYVLDELEPAEAAEFEEHFFQCALCADDLRKVSSLAANVRAVLREEDAIPVIEIGPGDRFLNLTIETRSEVPLIECEILCGPGPAPIVVEGEPLGGSVRIRLPAVLLAEGRCTAVLRDQRSGRELERREFMISKTSHRV